MTEITSFPWLPIELIERIILEAWRMRLTAKERTTLMWSSFLVNKTWMRAFAGVSSQDVHIPSMAYSRYFVSLIQHQPGGLYKKFALPNPNQHCETITFTLQSEARPKIMREIWAHEERREALGMSVAAFLSDIYSGFYLKRFHHLIIDYVNWYSEDIFTNFRFSTWPQQITNLEVNILSTEKANGAPLKGATANYMRRDRRLWYLDAVRDLTIVGGSSAFVSEMISTCNELRTLTVDGNLRMIAPDALPEFIHTITLCEHPMSERRGTFEERMERMLDGLHKGTHTGNPRVLVEREKIKDSVWMSLVKKAEDRDLNLMDVRDA